MSDYLPSDAELDRKIAACTSTEQIKEVTKAHLEAAGVIRREPGVGVHNIYRPAPEAVAQLGEPMLERELKFEPSTGRRTLILRATTKERLDELEAAILGYPSK